MGFIFDNISDRNDVRIDIRFIEGKSVIHKQIEKRDGLTFMRLKKRALA